MDLKNFSKTESDPFADVDLGNATFSGRELNTFDVVFEYIYIGLIFIKFLLSLVSLGADVVLIYVVLRFKRLKAKRHNLYIVHFAICHILYFVISPTILIIHYLISSGLYPLSILFCIIDKLEFTCLLLVFVFAGVMAIEWYISNFKQEWIIKFSHIYNYSFLIIYGLGIVKFIINFGFCFVHLPRIRQTFQIVIYCMALLFVTIVHVLKRKISLNKKQQNTKYILIVGSSILCSYLPSLLFNFVSSLTPYAFYIYFAMYVEWIADFISVIVPIIVCHVISKENKHFKMAFDTMFKRSVKAYGADNLDDASDTEEIVEEDRNDTENNENDVTEVEVQPVQNNQTQDSVNLFAY